MTLAQRRLTVAVLAVAGPLAWAAYKWATAPVVAEAFSFHMNPEASVGDEVDDAMAMIALAEWLRSTEVGVGGG